MPSGYEHTAIAAGSTLLGVLLGALSTYLFATRLQRLHVRSEAGRRLRASFVEALALVEDPAFKLDMAFAHDLQQAFPKHSAAVREFAFHLSQQDSARFQRVWQQYWQVGGSVRFNQYALGGESRALFIERVEKILNFTRH